MPTESFAPSVRLPGGDTVAPPSWMWVLAFALRGVPWAVTQCETDAWKDQARDWFRARDRYHVEDEIAGLEAQLAEARRKLAGLS